MISDEWVPKARVEAKLKYSNYSSHKTDELTLMPIASMASFKEGELLYPSPIQLIDKLTLANMRIAQLESELTIANDWINHAKRMMKAIFEPYNEKEWPNFGSWVAWKRSAIENLTK